MPKKYTVNQGCMSLCHPVIWSMAAMLRDSVVVVVVVRTRPRAIPLAMITMRKSTHGFPFVFHIWVAYGAPLGGPSGRRSSARNYVSNTSGLSKAPVVNLRPNCPLERTPSFSPRVIAWHEPSRDRLLQKAHDDKELWQQRSNVLVRASTSG